MYDPYSNHALNIFMYLYVLLYWYDPRFTFDRYLMCIHVSCALYVSKVYFILYVNTSSFTGLTHVVVLSTWLLHGCMVLPNAYSCCCAIIWVCMGMLVSCHLDFFKINLNGRVVDNVTKFAWCQNFICWGWFATCVGIAYVVHVQCVTYVLPILYGIG